jgi:hypothetical protein
MNELYDNLAAELDSLHVQGILEAENGGKLVLFIYL